MLENRNSANPRFSQIGIVRNAAQCYDTVEVHMMLAKRLAKLELLRPEPAGHYKFEFPQETLARIADAMEAGTFTELPNADINLVIKHCWPLRSLRLGQHDP